MRTLILRRRRPIPSQDAPITPDKHYTVDCDEPVMRSAADTYRFELLRTTPLMEEPPAEAMGGTDNCHMRSRYGKCRYVGFTRGPRYRRRNSWEGNPFCARRDS